MDWPSHYSKPIVYIELTLIAFFWGGTFIAGRIAAKEVAPFSWSLFLGGICTQRTSFLIA